MRKLEDEPLLHRGVELFNSGEFFECHEVLEELWGPRRGGDRLFLQAVIHLAVGFYHHQQGNRDGAERQLSKGLRKLAGYLPRYAGIDTGKLHREAQRYFESLANGIPSDRFPKVTAC